MFKLFSIFLKKISVFLVEECSYFVGNVLVQVRHVFLSDYPLVLFLLKPRDIRVFWNQKNSVQTSEAL